MDQPPANTIVLYHTITQMEIVYCQPIHVVDLCLRVSLFVPGIFQQVRALLTPILLLVQFLSLTHARPPVRMVTPMFLAATPPGTIIIISMLVAPVLQTPVKELCLLIQPPVGTIPQI